MWPAINFKQVLISILKSTAKYVQRGQVQQQQNENIEYPALIRDARESPKSTVNCGVQ